MKTFRVKLRVRVARVQQQLPGTCVHSDPETRFAPATSELFASFTLD